jgi:hypothetical protein
LLLLLWSQLMPLPGIGDWLPVLASRDCCIRVVGADGKPIYEIPTTSAPTALRQVVVLTQHNCECDSHEPSLPGRHTAVVQSCQLLLGAEVPLPARTICLAGRAGTLASIQHRNKCTHHLSRVWPVLLVVLVHHHHHHYTLG